VVRRAAPSGPFGRARELRSRRVDGIRQTPENRSPRRRSECRVTGASHAPFAQHAATMAASSRVQRRFVDRGVLEAGRSIDASCPRRPSEPEPTGRAAGSR
jgi:hypothetical protein